MNTETENKKSYIMLISSMIIVGTIGIFRRYIPLSSALLAFFRGIIGAASLFLFLIIRKEGKWKKISVKNLAGLVINGAFLGINWILLFEAYNYTTIAKATLCYYLQPTIVLLLSPLVFKEKLSDKKLICAVTALIGMVLVSGVINADGSQTNDFRGILFGLGAACFYSLVVIINKKIDSVDTYQKTVIQLASAAIVLIPYLLVMHSFNGLVINANVVCLLLVVGVVHTGIVYALYFGSMSGLKAQTISSLSYIDPIVALVVSTVILQEKMTVYAVVGAVLILGSAFISEYESKLHK